MMDLYLYMYEVFIFVYKTGGALFDSTTVKSKFRLNFFLFLVMWDKKNNLKIDLLFGSRILSLKVKFLKTLSKKFYKLRIFMLKHFAAILYRHRQTLIVKNKTNLFFNSVNFEYDGRNFFIVMHYSSTLISNKSVCEVKLVIMCFTYTATPFYRIIHGVFRI